MADKTLKQIAAEIEVGRLDTVVEALSKEIIDLTAERRMMRQALESIAGELRRETPSLKLIEAWSREALRKLESH